MEEEANPGFVDNPDVKGGNATKRSRSDTESEEYEDNPYLALRKKNMEEKRKMLIKLGIHQTAKSLNELAKPLLAQQKQQARIVKTRSIGTDPKRRSSRLASKEAVHYDEKSLEIQANVSPVAEKVEIRRQFFQGPEPMVPLTEGEETVKPSLGDLLPFLKTTAVSEKGLQDSLDNYKKILKNLKLAPEKIQKVGTSALFSLAVHPTESKVLVVTGDEKGHLGFWDSSRTDDGALELYRPHKAAVFCVSVNRYNSSLVYCTAIDGVTRLCDLEKMHFNDVYVADEEHCHTPYHTQMSPHSLLVAQGDGTVALVDLREDKQPTRIFECHQKSVRTVQEHPVQEHIFVTSSRLNSAAVWDIRVAKKHKPLFEVQHRKSLKSAFFSPGGGLLLTTCIDNRLRLYEIGPVIRPAAYPHVVMNTYHNNSTGPYLRPFKATWHPQRDDVFIIGSMERPRKVDIFGAHGLLVHELRSPQLQTILSNCQFHPTLPAVVGHNNSGRVHVFET